MELNITQELKLTQKEADKILRMAYLKGYFNNCDDVQNGCDIFRYIPSSKMIEFHIIDPMFWVELRLDQVIDCQIDLLERERHHQKKSKNVLQDNPIQEI